MEGLAGEDTSPCPPAWAGGPCLEGWAEARAVPPPLGGVQGTSELRLPARADKGPLRGSHKRFITGGGGQPAGLRRGTSMEQLWSLLQGAVRLSGVRGTP